MRALRLGPGASGKDSVIHLSQGEHYVSGDPEVVLSTILGSCVAACIRDPRAGVGGMNHFLLPALRHARQPGEVEGYASHLMDLLVTALLGAGAVRHRMEAKLFGGSSTLDGRTDIGARNGAFATEFLAREGIALTGRCLGGISGRCVEYWPVSGRARRRLNIAGEIVSLVPVALAGTGSLKLF